LLSIPEDRVPEPKVELAGTESNLEMQTLNYRIRLVREEEGGYTVIVPALPGCVTFGETIDEAIKGQLSNRVHHLGRSLCISSLP